MLIAMNRFFVAQGFEEAFEERWRKRKSFLDQSPGFMRFRLLKQEMAQAGLTEFISYAEWLDGPSFLGWTESQQSKQAHASATPMPQGMLARPPEFRAYSVALDQGYGHRTDFRSPHMDQLVEKTFAHPTKSQNSIFQTNQDKGLPPISIGALEGQLLEILLRANGSKRGLEIGTLGGYSTSWLARALPEDGQLITIEKDPERAELARSHFKEHGLAKKIEVRTGTALDVLKDLEALRDLDFVFIDADKANYGAYTQWALPRLRRGGLLLADNAYIWGGMNYYGRPASEVLYPTKGRLDSFTKGDFEGMSHCWSQLAVHEEFASLILPTGEGLGIGIKK